MFVAVLGIVIERDVLAFLIQQEIAGCGEAVGEGWLATKLVRKLFGFEHGLRMNARGLRESAVERKGRGSGVLARLVCEYEKLLFGVKFGIAKRDVGTSGGGWLKRRRRAGLGGRLHCRNTRSQQKREQ